MRLAAIEDFDEDALEMVRERLSCDDEVEEPELLRDLFALASWGWL